MATYAITGKLGTGKSKSAVQRMREALLQGRRVATNLNLNLEKLLPADSKANVIRIPDKPTVFDLDVIGQGNESYDEEKNGLLVLDELASWLNARTFADRNRQPVIDWLIHSRKRGWDVYFICQNINQIDKQVRESLIEYVVRCSRMDKLKVPVIGGLLKTLTLGFYDGTLPRFHVATVRMGLTPDSLVVDRWFYRGDDLNEAYDTRQIFTDTYDEGPFTYLPPAYFKRKTKLSLVQHLQNYLKKRQQNTVRTLKPKRPEIERIMSLPPDARIAMMHKTGITQ